MTRSLLPVGIAADDVLHSLDEQMQQQDGIFAGR
jgi:hypothetical protein